MVIYYLIMYPMDTLYLLLPKESDNFERIFTIQEETNKVFWY